MRAALLVAVMVSGCQGPRVRLSATPLEGTRPQLVLLECNLSGFPARPRFAWKLPPGVKTSGTPPLDEGALLVQLADRLRTAETVECTAIGEGDPRKSGPGPGNLTATARLALGPLEINAARAAGSQLTVEGAGFGPQAAEDDAVWLVPARGRALKADHACPGASWSESKLSVCLPKLSKDPYQVRVQSGGRLALGPAVTLP